MFAVDWHIFRENASNTVSIGEVYGIYRPDNYWWLHLYSAAPDQIEHCFMLHVVGRTPFRYHDRSEVQSIYVLTDGVGWSAVECLVIGCRLRYRVITPPYWSIAWSMSTADLVEIRKHIQYWLESNCG